MTNYQSPGRNQKARGLGVKQALQFTLMLAICVWLLYQIKPSHNENKNHGLSTWGKLSQEGRTLILGRKGCAVWSSNRSDSGSKGAHFMEENDVTDNSGTGNWKTDEVLDKEKAIMENDKDEIVTEMESGSTLEHHGIDNVTISGHTETEDGNYSFPDENGIPEELEKEYQKINFDHSSISSTHIRGKMSKKTAVPRQNSVQHKFAAKNKDDGTTEDLKNDIKADVDSSTLKIMQVKSKYSDDFRAQNTL
ncbi:hypothetical protein ACET3Z_012232 [Daucus carota]